MNVSSQLLMKFSSFSITGDNSIEKLIAHEEKRRRKKKPQRELRKKYLQQLATSLGGGGYVQLFVEEKTLIGSRPTTDFIS